MIAEASERALVEARREAAELKRRTLRLHYETERAEEEQRAAAARSLAWQNSRRGGRG
jgi:hypothetical protein